MWCYCPYAAQERCASWRTIGLSVSRSQITWGVEGNTVQNPSLPSPILTRDLQSPSFDKVQHNTIRQFLHLDVGDSGYSEFAQMESPSCTTIRSILAIAVGCKGRGEDEVALRVKEHRSTFPEEGIWELDIHVTDVDAA